MQILDEIGVYVGTLYIHACMCERILLVVNKIRILSGFIQIRVERLDNITATSFPSFCDSFRLKTL